MTVIDFKRLEEIQRGMTATSSELLTTMIHTVLNHHSISDDSTSYAIAIDTLTSLGILKELPARPIETQMLKS